MTAIPEQLASALADRYRLDRELGAGGMATVYLAHDLRHDRRVAVKVLHPELSAVLGGERFLSEIKTTAALQHPHILPLFDSGSAGGLLFYVMPLVEGETLRTRLFREKQLPIADAVRLATQVAGALDYAHRHGVIHRDIKPENILLHEGSALVADFGISLAVQHAGGQRMTQTGLSLGTPQYMSPEQAMGEREITARSDLYALGAVTYEMLTGDPPFTGSSTQAIVARILTEEPRPIGPQRKSVPEHVEAAVLTALEKLPADRFGSVAEFAAALAGGTGAVSRVTAAGRTAARPAAARGSREAILFGVALLLGALAAWGWLRPSAEADTPVTRYAVTLPRAVVPQFGSRLALSPDGSRLVFVGPRADSAPGSQLWQRVRDALETSPIQGTEGASNPAFSPDGARIAFLSGSSPATLKVVSLAGGLPTELARGLMGVAGLSWGSDGWLYVDGLGGSLFRVPEAGGTPTVAIGPDTTAGVMEINTPAALPNGRGVLVRTHPSSEQRSWMVGVLDLETMKLRPLLPGVAARYLASGHLLVIGADGTLGVAPFDQDRLEVSGDVVNLGRGVHVNGWQVNIATGRDAFAYAQGSSARDSVELIWLAPDGAVTPAAPGWIDAIEQVALSPDGSKVAAVIRDLTGVRRLWIRQLDNGAMNRLSMEESAAFPSFSRDGRNVYYARTTSDRQSLVMRPVDGSRGETVLAWAPIAMRYGIEAPGGELIIEVYDNARFSDLMTVRPGQDTVARPLRATGVEEADGVVSPDGRWLAYFAAEGGGQHVYVRPYPNLDETVWQISRDNGYSAAWSRDGRELFYQTIEGTVEAVEVLPGPTFTMGRRRTAFTLGELRLNLPAGVQARDGRFLALRRVSAAPDLQIVVVQNFAAELRALAPRR